MSDPFRTVANLLKSPANAFRGVLNKDGGQFAKIARLWRPADAPQGEAPTATVSRYSQRLVDNATGQAYSADELKLSSSISDSTAAGRALLTAADVATQRGLLGESEIFSKSVIDFIVAHRTANANASPRALLAWARCLSELESGGILDELTDGACLRHGFNSATSYISIRNAVATIRGTVPIGPLGAIFTASTSNTLQFAVADSKVSTLAYDFRYNENTADYATPLSLTASTGTATAGRSIQPNAADASRGAVYQGNGGSAVYSSAIGDTSDAFNVHRYNALETFVSVSSDNAASPTVKVWINGLPVLTDSAGNLQQTSDLTLLTIGAQRTGASSYTLPHSGSVASWLLFNRVLTDAENITVSKALRHLDPRTKNMVLMGDSRTAQLSTSADYRIGSWPYQYWRSPAINRSVRLINTARNGWTAIAIRDGFATRAAHHGINGTSVLECDAVIWTGVNDWLADYTDAQAWGYVQTTIGHARAQGMNVIVGTDPEANGALSVGREAWRVAYNTTLRDNKHLVDSLWDIDLFLKAPRTSAAWLNDYHLNNLGNGWLAGNLLSGGLQGLTTP